MCFLDSKDASFRCWLHGRFPFWPTPSGARRGRPPRVRERQTWGPAFLQGSPGWSSLGVLRGMRAQSQQCRSCSPMVGKPNLGSTRQARDSSAHRPRGSVVSKQKGPFPYLSATPPPGQFVWCAHCRRLNAVMCGSWVPLSNFVTALHFISLWVMCVKVCPVLGFSPLRHET